MRINTYEFEITSRSQSLDLYFIADTHIGCRGFSATALQKDINTVKDNPNARWIGLGDWCEAINYTDPRFDADTIDPEFHNYLDDLHFRQGHVAFDRFLIQIKDKCIGIHTGNHDDKIRKKYHYKYVDKYCDEWGVPYLGFTALTRLVIVRKTKNETPSKKTIILLTGHGSVAGRKDGGKTNRLNDMMSMFEADIYAIGHGHKKITTRCNIIGISTNKKPRIINRKKIGLMTGAYLRGYIEDHSSYVEEKMLPPTDLGMVGINIKLGCGRENGHPIETIDYKVIS